MQGQKRFEPKEKVNFYLPDQIPGDNLYKRLKEHLDLSFVYDLTKGYYSHTGKPSIDPVVFFKCVLIGYLENICSDRALERAIKLRLDLLYFIDHDLGESPPDHSTICKTRKRLPVEIFEDVFNHILKLCVESGLVKGQVQSIDTAYINANASLDRMEEVKLTERDPAAYLEEVQSQDSLSNVYGHNAKEVAKKRLEKSQQSLERYTEYRRAKYSELDGGKKRRKQSRRFLSNATHMSRTDPDARIAKKSGKPRLLCYSALLGVDTANNVITHISAEHSSKKDSRILLAASKSLQNRLKDLGLNMELVLADAGFSSGENYAALNQMGVKSYIPVHGGYKEKREGFSYDPKKDAYTCSQGQELNFAHIGKSGGYYKKRYYSKKKICDACPVRQGCVGKRGFKKIEHTIYKKEYDEMLTRLKTEQGRASYALRMQSVEPVFGTLQQHYGLRWINVRGKQSAHKVMLMAAAALNLKKYLKHLMGKAFLVWLYWIINMSKQKRPFYLVR